jgi:hypothetical protein
MSAQTEDFFEDPTPEQIAKGALNPHLNPRSTHQGGGRGKDDDDNPTRAMAAVALRLGGAGLDTIAAQLGYASPRRVRDVIERALAESVDNNEDKTEMRRVQHARLERMLTSVWTRANNPKDPDHLAYSARALAIIDRENRMLGLDMPTEVTMHHIPELTEVKAWVDGMTARLAGEPAIVEAEILEIEAGQTWTDQA